MATQLKRATIYIRPDIHQALKLKSAVTNQSISDLVNEALLTTLSEDEEDLRAFEERAGEPLMSYEELLTKLKADGKI
ncbi:MAG: CopG family transcriptional regulator [Acidobacteriota bacterium]